MACLSGAQNEPLAHFARRTKIRLKCSINLAFLNAGPKCLRAVDFVLAKSGSKFAHKHIPTHVFTL